MSEMSQLEARVRAAIGSDRLVGDASRITISADEIGSVTLRGTVSTLLQSWAATRAARRVPGVLNVINEIAVRPLRRGRSANARPEKAASSDPRPSAGVDSGGTANREDLDDELQRLSRQSRSLGRNEEQAEASIRKEWRREHWGREPSSPPSWEEPDTDPLSWDNAGLPDEPES